MSKSVILRARWNGALPVANDYLRSQGKRTRYAYRIIDVELAVATPIGSDVSKLKLTCERIPATDIPAGVVPHDWRWEQRKTKKNGTGAGWSAL